jgi:alpha-mannosidase
MADKYPEMNAEIAQRIKEGRWEIVGGMWVEPDLNMPDGESLVRQLLVGKRWYKQAYGVDVRIGWNPDSFGYTWQLPQIYKKSGVDYFVTQKMTWNDTNQLPFKLFWWESPDGSKVLAYFPHDYGNLNLSPVRLSADLVAARTRATGMTDMMDLYGIGDHGGGPTRAVLDRGVSLGDAFDSAEGRSEYAVRHCADVVLNGREADCAGEQGVELPVDCQGIYAAAGSGEWRGRWDSDVEERAVLRVSPRRDDHAGQPQAEYARQRGRGAERGEVFVAGVAGWPRVSGAELTEDWKKVLFNQFHDLAAGSGIGVIYKDAQKDYDVVRWSTNEISAGALETVAETRHWQNSKFVQTISSPRATSSTSTTRSTGMSRMCC